MIALKVQQLQDGALGVVLDEETLRSLGVGEGDLVMLSQSPEATADESEIDETARQIEIGRGILGRYRKTFEALAK